MIIKNMPASISPVLKPLLLLLLTSVMSFTLGTSSFAQVSPEEHAKHHPGGTDAAQAPAESGAESGGEAEGASSGGMMGGGGMGGGMGGSGGMGDMMKSMGVPPPKELYPELIALPDLPLEKRAAVQQQAHERMQEGAALLGVGLERLLQATPNDDFRTMQSALDEMRQGLAHFDSGLAAHRALAEGSAPRNIALQWFKREMNLLEPMPGAVDQTVFGLSPFHFYSMIVLIAFAATMIWMYFHKMRRAQELLQAIASQASSPVPAAAEHAQKISPAPPAPAPAPTAAPAAPAAPATTKRAPEPKSKPSAKARKKWSGHLRVCRIFKETRDISTFRMMPTDGQALPFHYLPGQFLTLTVEPDGKPVKRSYTISSSPTVQDYLEISVKREEQGTVSRYLHDHVKEGDELSIQAPAGRLTFTGEEADGIVLIGGGVGITPMMSVIRYLTDRGWNGSIHFLYCCKTTKDFAYREELEYLQRRNRNLNVLATMTREDGTVWMGLKGRLTRELIASAVPGIEKLPVHICGPPAMMDAMKSMLGELGVPADLIQTEAFGPAKKPKPKTASSTPTVPSGKSATEQSSRPQATVTFAIAKKTAPLGCDETVLDVADAVGVEIESSCRSGSCGACKVKLLEGQVSMETDDALDPEEKAQGYVLACQATSEASVVIDA